MLATAPLAAQSTDRLEITEVKVHPVQVGGIYPSEPPKFTSDFDPARSRWMGPFAQLPGAIIVEIRTKPGLTGYGMGCGGGAGAFIIEHHLKDLLVGANALNVELLWEQMYQSTLFYGRKGVTIMAISGVDLALWDLRGRHYQQPVHRLLGGPTREKVPAYYTGFRIEEALKLGFQAFKYPIRYGVEQGTDGMRKIVTELTEARRKIGPDALLMIDCLCRWDVPYTLEMARRLEEVNLHWIEEPISPDDLEGYARLCREVKGPLIASGEHEYTRYGFNQLIQASAVQLVQPDTTWCGGLTELRRISALAAAHSLPMIPHRGSSPYGLSVIVTTPNCPLAESFGTLERQTPLICALTSRFENGFYYPSDKPGFGADLTAEMLSS